jgi:hypothetical protein
MGLSVTSVTLHYNLRYKAINLYHAACSYFNRNSCRTKTTAPTQLLASCFSFYPESLKKCFLRVVLKASSISIKYERTSSFSVAGAAHTVILSVCTESSGIIHSI